MRQGLAGSRRSRPFQAAFRPTAGRVGSEASRRRDGWSDLAMANAESNGGGGFEKESEGGKRRERKKKRRERKSKWFGFENPNLYLKWKRNFKFLSRIILIVFSICNNYVTNSSFRVQNFKLTGSKQNRSNLAITY